MGDIFGSIPFGGGGSLPRPFPSGAPSSPIPPVRRGSLQGESLPISMSELERREQKRLGKRSVREEPSKSTSYKALPTTVPFQPSYESSPFPSILPPVSLPFPPSQPSSSLPFPSSRQPTSWPSWLIPPQPPSQPPPQPQPQPPIQWPRPPSSWIPSLPPKPPQPPPGGNM